MKPLESLFSARTLEIALTSSVGLQAHYAKLLNMHDGGERVPCETAKAFIEKLIEAGTIVSSEARKDALSQQFWVTGVVANRDKMPYIQFSNENGLIAQLDMVQARQVSADILQMAARTEADAMILKFFDKARFPDGAGAALMIAFRDFRAELDAASPPRT